MKARLWGAFQRLVGTDDLKIEILRGALDRQGRTLEVGCGTGNVAEAFRGCEYLGVDTDGEKVEQARRRWAGESFSFEVGRLEELALPRRRFDFAVASHLIHHLDEGQLRSLLAEVAAVLKAEGTLVVLDMVRPRKGDPLGAWFYCHLDRGRYIRSAPEICRILESCGFTTLGEPRLFGCRKLGFRIIEQVLVRARGQGGGTVLVA